MKDPCDNPPKPTMTWEKAVIWLRGQPDQQALVRYCFYDDPLLAAATRYYESSEWKAVQQILPSACGTALDLGAGRGIAAFALAKDGWQVTALEPDPSQVVGAGAIRALAEESGTAIRVVQEWGENLPFADNSFDAVHARQVLHHARDLHQLCSEIGRVLKPGGTFIATREHVINSPSELSVFLAAHPLHSLYYGENAFMRHEYVNALTAGGLKVTKILSPWESDINCFPDTRAAIASRLRRKLVFPLPDFLIYQIMHYKSRRFTNPGRLYTFVGKK